MAATGFLFGDTFDGYPTADLLLKWTNFTGVGSTRISISSLAARNGAAGLRLNAPNSDDASAQTIRKTLTPGDPTTFVAKFAFRYDHTNPSFIFPFISINDNNTQQTCLALRPDGKLAFYRGALVSGLIGTTPSNTALLGGNWYFIKMKVVLHGSAGTVDLWINGVSEISLTGQNTITSGSAIWTNFYLGQPVLDGQGNLGGGALDFRYDDLIVRDDDNGYQDTIGIILRAQAGNGSNTDYTPSTGTDHGALVDDTNQDGDSTMNTSSTVGHKDTYNLENLPVSATIECVQTTEVARKTDAGSRIVANVLRISGTDYVGPNIAPNQTYSHLLTQYDESPATSTAFTDTEVNGMQSGQTIVS